MKGSDGKSFPNKDLDKHKRTFGIRIYNDRSKENINIESISYIDKMIDHV